MHTIDAFVLNLTGMNRFRFDIVFQHVSEPEQMADNGLKPNQVLLYAQLNRSARNSRKAPGS